MSTVDEVFESSRERPLGLRRRTDLVIVPQVNRDERYWMIKDPLEMEFYRLNEEEYAVLTMIDGKQSLDEIKESFELRFPPQRITHRDLQSFISDLHNKCLLAYTDPDIGLHLIERAKEKQWKKFKKNFSGILSFKWRGIDPDRFLDWLTPKVGWMFSLPAVIVALLFMGVALLWLLVHWSVFLTRLPGLGDFLQPRNWLLLGCVVIVLKIIHEFGHGISFKRFGGECNEIGVMWMLFIPTLYCSTTDSWLIRSKWKRAAIGAAGMYVETVIAAFATFVWWFSEPGTLNMVCLNIMATGSLSVLMVNANPFLKYDGYYVLSDILEIPNLRERAGKTTHGWFLRYGLGVEEDIEQNSRLDTKVTLVLYNFAAFGFRMLVVGLVLFLLIERLQPFGLGYLGLAMGCFAICSLFAPPMWSLYQFFKIPGRIQRIKMKRLLPTLAICIGLVVLIGVVPFPHHVICAFTIRPHGSQTLYVKHDAVLKKVHVVPGQKVAAGDLLAELENLESLLKFSKLKSDGDEIKSEIQSIERSRDTSSVTTNKLNELKESHATNLDSLRQYEEVVLSFRVTAPRDGDVIPEWTSDRRETSGQLESWAGSPLAKENLGTSLSSGTKLCTIGDLTSFDAVLVVNEHDIRFVKEGQTVSLLLDSNSLHRILGQIGTIAAKESEDLPGSLSTEKGGSIALQTPTTSNAPDRRPADEHFEASVVLPECANKLSSGLRGQARIRVGSRTLIVMGQQYFYRSFRKAL